MLCGLNQSELIGEPILLWLNMFQPIRLWTSSLQSLLLSGLTRFSSSSQEWFIWVETWESALQEALLKQGWTSRRRWSSCVALKPFWNPFETLLPLRWGSSALAVILILTMTIVAGTDFKALQSKAPRFVRILRDILYGRTWQISYDIYDLLSLKSRWFYPPQHHRGDFIQCPVHAMPFCCMFLVCHFWGIAFSAFCTSRVWT